MGKNQSLDYPYPLILASSSKYRAKLLEQLDLNFISMNPGVDEEKIKKLESCPEKIASKLSLFKAQAIQSKRPEACIIGSDQVCSMDGEIFSKPETKERATEQISRLQGKMHELITAVAIVHPKGCEMIVNRTKLFMRPLTLKQIHSYINADLPMDCAGSYKLESKGIKLFSKIEMTDHTAIIGLPLIELTTHLIKLGYSL